jgi:hypothetical protein
MPLSDEIVAVIRAAPCLVPFFLDRFARCSGLIAGVQGVSRYWADVVYCFLL